MKHSNKIVFAFLLGGALALALTNCSSGEPSEVGISGPGSSSSGDGGSSSSSFVDDGGGNSSSFDGGDSSSSFVDDEGDSSSSSDNGDDVSSSSASVCNGITYDPATQRCNNSVVETNCGGGWYNASTHFCHNGTNILSKCNGSTYDPQTHFCHNNAPFSKCGGNLYDPDVLGCCGGTTFDLTTQRCNSNVVETECGGDWYDASTQFCYNNSSVGDFCGNNPQKSYNPGLYECEPGSNGIYLKSGVSDNEGKKYKAVLIGNQTWMAENLNVAPATGNSWCYNNDPANCVKYGRLYDWAAANTACPSGWKLPEKDDWDKLTAAVGAPTEGKVLKDKYGWNTCGPVGSGESNACEDTYGFSALPGGYHYLGTFGNAGGGGYWWSASEYNINNAYYRSMYRYNEYAGWDNGYKSYGHSVRCLED